MKVCWQTLNVHDGEEGGNEGFTYITLKTWSGSATLRKVEKIIDLNGKQKEQTRGGLKTHSEAESQEFFQEEEQQYVGVQH